MKRKTIIEIQEDRTGRRGRIRKASAMKSVRAMLNLSADVYWAFKDATRWIKAWLV